MSVAPNPYDIIRAIQDQQAVMLASQRATERLVTMLAGMLDASAPDPLVHWNPPPPATEPPARVLVRAEPAQWRPRLKARSNRPTRKIVVAGTPVIVSEMRAQMVDALKERPRTTEEIVALGLSKTADSVRKAFVALNFDFSKLGIPLRIKPVERLSRVGPKGGSILPRYALIDPAAAAQPAPAEPATESTNADPDNPPSVQSEAEAGSSPGQEAPASAVGEGDLVVTAHGAPFVMPAGGEVASRVESPSAADEQNLPERASKAGGSIPLVDRDQVKSPFESGRRAGCSGTVGGPAGTGRSDGGERPAPSKPAPECKPPAIGLGMLIGVDLVGCHVAGPAGDYKISGQKMARTLDMLRGGLMFGLDIVAKRCGWQSAEVARSALQLERDRLAGIGIDMHLDKFNVRLRVVT